MEPINTTAHTPLSCDLYAGYCMYVCMYVCMHVCVLFSKHTHSHTYYTECNFLTAAIQFGQLQ